MTTADPTTVALPGSAPPPAEEDPPPVLPLAVRDRPAGPAVGALLRRTSLIACAVGAASVIGLARSRTPRGKATALGALTPGAGYLYTRDRLRFAATLPVFAASLVAWFGSGNIVAPVAVWAGTAAGARRRAGRVATVDRRAEVLVPATVAAAAVAGTVGRRRAFDAARERGRQRATYLRTLGPRPLPRPGVPGELSADDLAVARGLLDLGLQPVERLDGFDRIDQFQTAAIRYQCNFAQWALAMAQLHHTPAFQGYLAAAQRNLIDKLTLPAVWGYWRWEQLWGNLTTDFDPMARDNVMLSGYLGTMLGVYESNTGDRWYRQPGALPFRLGRRRWDYDTERVAAAVHANFTRSRLCLFPCEPNWVYSGCNMTAINTLILADRLLGTTYADDVLDRFRDAMLHEFTTPDGRITAIRSSRFGFTIPALTSTMADCASIPFLNPSMPDLARRTWEIARRELVHYDGTGEPRLELRGWDRIDTGNYRRGDAGAFVAVQWAAAEIGDRDLYDALEVALERRHPTSERDGVRWRDRSSTNLNAMAALARFSPAGGFRSLVCDGPPDTVRRGPYLEEASYPDVLVARAVTDGTSLDLVVAPGGAGGRVRLGVHRLRPGTTYRALGAVEDAVVSDDAGRAHLTVDLGGRTEVRLAPDGS